MGCTKNLPVWLDYFSVSSDLFDWMDLCSQIRVFFPSQVAYVLSNRYIYMICMFCIANRVHNRISFLLAAFYNSICTGNHKQLYTIKYKCEIDMKLNIFFSNIKIKRIWCTNLVCTQSFILIIDIENHLKMFFTLHLHTILSGNTCTYSQNCHSLFSEVGK